MRRIRSPCCARAGSGHVAAAPGKLPISAHARSGYSDRLQIERGIIMIECSICVAIPMLLIIGLVGILAVLFPHGADIL
jgi:hypothetical protein